MLQSALVSYAAVMFGACHVILYDMYILGPHGARSRVCYCHQRTPAGLTLRRRGAEADGQDTIDENIAVGHSIVLSFQFAPVFPFQ